MRFGVREICDVTFKAASNDQKVGHKVFKKYQPVFMIDTARTSNFEQASTTVYAQGGRGYARLLAWEGEKTMTFTVEDALISPMGLAVLSGAGLINHSKNDCAHVHATIEKVVGKSATDEPQIVVDLEDLKDETGFTTASIFHVCTNIPSYATILGSTGKAEDFLELQIDPDEADGDTFKVTESVPATFKLKGAVPSSVYGKTVVIDFYLVMTNSAQTITIGPEDFGGYYYVEAQTLFRDEGTGKDLAANITFPKIKIQSGFTFTMAASGDPSTFTFTMDAFPGYTITKKNKKTICDIQILSLEATEEEDSITCDSDEHTDIDTPVFYEELNVAADIADSSKVSGEEAKANQEATQITRSGNVITLSEVAGKQWTPYASATQAQGTHEWVGVIIDTGEDDITKVTFNGTPLTQADVEEAASVGAGAGKFILWVKADDTEGYPRTIKLGTEGKPDTELVIKVING